MADYTWPEASRRALLGKRINRVDGPAKSSGRVTYTFDVRRPGMLFGKLVHSPHAHARVVSFDTAVAEAMPGVRAVDIIMQPGREVMWAGQEVAAVAAETENQARDAARQVQVQYEVLPYWVRDSAPSEAPADRVEVLAE